jgi:putative ABC transport system permease protein
MNFQRYVHTFSIALEAVFAHRFRSFLTALGIIFGVAAVISMMAIGNGARQEILEQIKLVGVNNIVITPVLEGEGSSSDEAESSGQQVKQKYSPGLTLSDAESIMKIIPTVDRVSPEVTYDTYIIKAGKRSSAKLNGVSNEFFQVYNLGLEKGNYFSNSQLEQGSPVCIIGPSVKAKFFPQQEGIGEYIKCGAVWLKVIGIIEKRQFSLTDSEDIGIASYSQQIYAPVQTVLRRFRDRALVNEASLRSGGSEVVFVGGGIASFSSYSAEDKKNYHQLDKIVVQVDESENLKPTTEVLEKMLMRRHANVKDYEIMIPELLLKQEQRTKDIFNIVLAVIASISLLVGGIGIMNIMLASVMERIREIGVRMATGATKKDIVFQFLSEATLISVTGGIIGIILGILFARIINSTTGILTIVSPLSLLVSFGVSASIGILFGYMPAKRASEQDPVETLRYE